MIYLRCCLGVSRIGSSRKGHTVALYDKAQTMVLVMEDQQQQEDWYGTIKKLMEEEQKEEEHAEGVDEDDGYCTLPPGAFFKEVGPDFYISPLADKISECKPPKPLLKFNIFVLFYKKDFLKIIFNEFATSTIYPSCKAIGLKHVLHFKSTTPSSVETCF